MSHQNPFAMEDPFADPSISNALNQSAYVSLDDGMGTSATHQSPAVPASSSGATMMGGSPQIMIDMKEKEAELRRREEELAARERQFQQQEDALRRAGLHPPNWLVDGIGDLDSLPFLPFFTDLSSDHHQICF
jgi:hypothetical protein